MRSDEFLSGQARQGLSDHDKRVLDFARDLDGRAPDDVHTQFGFGPEMYYRQLNTLLSNPDAATYAPETVSMYRKAFGHDPD